MTKEKDVCDYFGCKGVRAGEHPAIGRVIFSDGSATAACEEGFNRLRRDYSYMGLKIALFADDGHGKDDAVAGTKDSNPKDAIGITKLPLHLVPPTAIAMASIAHLNGALKYGKYNWRKCGVKASIYLDAAKRHFAKYESGEEVDEDGVPHLASILACVGIVIDAKACGKLNDDRPPRVPITKFMEELTPMVGQLSQLHAGKSPKHFTIADSEEGDQ